jgi:hypothetical protein
MRMYAFHLRGLDDAPVALELLELPDDAATFARASRLLEEHPTCGHIEVWEGERPVLARHRTPPIIRSIPSSSEARL